MKEWLYARLEADHVVAKREIIKFESPEGADEKVEQVEAKVDASLPEVVAQE